MKGFARPLRPLSKVSKWSVEMGVWLEERLDGGMVTILDPSDLENKFSTYLLNARVRPYGTSVRAGYSPATDFVPAPDFPPLSANAVTYPNGVNRTFIFTTDGVQYLDTPTTWADLVPPATGYNLAFSDHVAYALLGDKLGFTTNGVKALQLIGSAAVPDISEPKAGLRYKYIAAFFNRLVLANLVGSPNNSIKIEWCADGDPTKWDGDDRTAGSALLLNGPSDLDDEITGLQAINNILFVFRKRSIWAVNRQASATAPFSVSPYVKGIGCSFPYSLTPVRDGVVWADERTQTVWFFDGQNYPKRIGYPIEPSLFTDFNNQPNNDRMHGAYDPTFNEFYLMVFGGLGQVAPSFAKLWIYNFDTEQWAFDAIRLTEQQVISVFDVRLGSYSLPINALQGNIQNLTGNIEDLGQNAAEVDTLCLGLAGSGTGLDEIDYSNRTAINDTADYPTATTWQSKVFEIPTDDVAIGEVRFEYANSADEYLDFFYAINGATMDYSTPFKRITSSTQPGTKLFRIPLNVSCRQFQFGVRFTTPETSPGVYPLVGSLARITKYEVHVYKLGRSEN